MPDPARPSPASSSSRSPFALPAGFRFGVACAGFQVEGGYNGPGEPRNNWYEWERDGRVEPSGIALDLWRHPDQHLDRAAALGCDAFRLSVEWARCEPLDGQWDTGALDRYAEILRGCHERGLEPLVTLHHFTHPHWLGPDLWLDGDSPARFAAWAARAVEHLGDLCTTWITVNEPNILALQTYLTGDFPPATFLRTGKVARALDHLFAAHVEGHAAVKARRPHATVATNTFTFSVYELDRLWVDVLDARVHGIARADLHDWLVGRRREHHDRVDRLSGPEPVLRAWAARAIPLEEALPRTVAAVYASEHLTSQDVAQVDHYQARTADHIRVPGHRTSGGRSWLPATSLWDDRPDPGAFAAYTRWAVAPDRPVWVVENGLCNRVRRGRPYPRLDGWTRPRYLRAHLGALCDLVEAGVPVEGYFHWTLADNYEWGSYEPRFGLYGVDRERGLRWLDADSMGQDSAGAYRRIIEGLRAGDRSVVDP